MKFFLLQLFRHGIRYSVNLPYPNDPNTPWYPIVFPGTPGKLTEVGQRDMFNVGQNLKRRYGDCWRLHSGEGARVCN
ncbi:hypothetical protein J6590_023305 [Homalodisca vitripennis]|nr:hypothetical protein J6590_023305 [Homalodisca vitripennis]